ncbi:MAG TPA: hypothetical protein VG872_00875 [Acidimicrobiia bacterium]|jgi:hypothetical protein|nr:hypothetical protein [Acidimicrobiia bacterium]
MRRSVVLALTLALVACTGAAEETEGGDGLPVQNPAETYGHDSAEISGTVTLEPNGCWTIDLGDGKRLLVFPAGYTMDNELALMLSPDGQVDVGDGDLITGLGGVVSAEGFPGVPDGFWGNYLAFCEPEIGAFAVVDEITSVDV